MRKSPSYRAGLAVAATSLTACSELNAVDILQAHHADLLEVGSSEALLVASSLVDVDTESLCYESAEWVMLTARDTNKARDELTHPDEPFHWENLTGAERRELHNGGWMYACGWEGTEDNLGEKITNCQQGSDCSLDCAPVEVPDELDGTIRMLTRNILTTFPQINPDVTRSPYSFVLVEPYDRGLGSGFPPVAEAYRIPIVDPFHRDDERAKSLTLQQDKDDACSGSSVRAELNF